MYLRLQGTEETIALAKELFGDLSMLSREGQPADEYAFIIAPMKESDIDSGIEKLRQSGCSILGSVRVLDY